MQIPAGTFLDKENQTRRCPCIVLLDTSGSMSGEPISKLNAALPLIKGAIDNDNTARNAVELAVVTFGGHAQVVQDWTDIEHLAIPSLAAGGGTPLGAALLMAMDMIESRRAVYKHSAIPCYVPWVFILTDGAPDRDDQLNAAISRAQQLQQVVPPSKAPKLIVFACSTDTSPEAMGLLKSVTQRTFELAGMAFQEVFVWLAASLSKSARATPGQPMAVAPLPGQMNLSQATTITP
jgi:uncharacterized protein YegL